MTVLLWHLYGDSFAICYFVMLFCSQSLLTTVSIDLYLKSSLASARARDTCAGLSGEIMACDRNVRDTVIGTKW